MNRKISLKKVILNDYTAFTAFMLPIVLAGGYGIFRVTDEAADDSPDLLLIFGAISIASILLLVWRISVFNAIFNDGMEAPATISSVWIIRDRVRLSYVYIYQGQKYKYGCTVMKRNGTGGYWVGDEVVVLVDRGKPKRAFLRDLYMA